MGDRVNKDEIEKASQVHIADYLESKGESLIKEGKYYRHKEHDSLIINENGKWFWNSRNQGGFGAISFAREYYNLSFQDAVRDVNSEGISSEMTFNWKRKSNEEKQEFNYPEQYESRTQDNIKEYLINERAIDPKVIESLLNHDLIAEDKLKNCVFKWKDKDNKVVGADRQGTVQMEDGRYFKQVVANSKEDGGFKFDIGIPTKIALFESPIDAVSYFDLHRPNNIRLQSMSGLKDRSAARAIKDLLKENKDREIPIEKVILGVDNDQSGEKFARKWGNLIGISERHTPKGKDWNEDLQKRREQELKRTNIVNIMDIER